MVLPQPDMQLEQEIIKIWRRLIMEGQNLDWTEYFLPVAIICLNWPFARYFQLSARSVTHSSIIVQVVCMRIVS